MFEEDLYLIIDLEATCFVKPDERQGRDNETIEIGAVFTDKNFVELGRFQTFVKPVINPELSEFCTELTTITQADVDDAPSFPVAMHALQHHCYFTYQKLLNHVTWCSWGNYDRNQLQKDCDYHHIAYPMGAHINLKQVVAKTLGKKPMGVARAAAFLNIPFVGTHHRGIDDAVAITKISSVAFGKKV